MNTETEIKLRASAATLAALKEHPLIVQYNASGWHSSGLYNAYYDTSCGDLAQARVALRVRCDGDVYIQTLKSRGQSVAGLSERQEWDWYLDNEQLVAAHLTDECWPASLADLDKELLQPIFRTDFTREKAELRWVYNEQNVVVEIALDQGQVVSDHSSETISEVELELREGPAEALLALALSLAESLPLMPCDISKAERGYRLLGARRQSLNSSELVLSPEQSVDDAFAAIAWALLGDSQRLAEQYRHQNNWTALVAWWNTLVELRALLSSLGQAVPRASSQALRSKLDALIADWRDTVLHGGEEESLRQQAVTEFARELDQCRWGVFSLQFAIWLLNSQWKVGRKDRGTRQGVVPLSRWLPHTLGDEARELDLVRCQSELERLLEQEPRLQRMLVWLHHARAVLELSEVDRLFGELNKLYSAVLERRVLAEREHSARQCQIISSLPAWKVLLK